MSGGQSFWQLAAIIIGTSGIGAAAIAAFATLRVNRATNKAAANEQAIEGFSQLASSLQADNASLRDQRDQAIAERDRALAQRDELRREVALLKRRQPRKGTQ